MFGFFLHAALLPMRMILGAAGMLVSAGSHLFSGSTSPRDPRAAFRAGRARGMSLDELYRAGRDQGMARGDLVRVAYAEGVPLGDVIRVVLDDGMDPKDLRALAKRERVPDGDMVKALLELGRPVREVFALQSVPRKVTDTFEKELRASRSFDAALKATYKAHAKNPGAVANLAAGLGAEPRTLQGLGLGAYHTWYEKHGGEGTLRAALAGFHGNPLELAAALAGMRANDFPCTSAGRPHEMRAHQTRHARVVDSLAEQYRALASRDRRALLEQAIDAWLDEKRGSEPTWRLLASSRDEALEALVAPIIARYVSEPFVKDPDADKITEGMRSIFANLPGAFRLRLVAAVLAEGPFEGTQTLLCTLLRTGGVGAVKGGQQLSENEDVPARFREALKPLKDDVTTLDTAEVAALIDPQVNEHIDTIGERVGTGSAKQVNRVVAVDGRRLALCVAMPDGLASFHTLRDACKDVPFIKNILDRLTPMVERELDMRSEAKAFAEVRDSRLGRCDYVDIPEVVTAAKGSLLREHVAGETLAAILRKQPKASRQLKTLLARFHADLILTALPAREHGLGLVMTDPHDANFTVRDGKRIGLFDVGQREFLTHDEGTLFLALMSQLLQETPNDEVIAKLSAHLAAHCDHGTHARDEAASRLHAAFADVATRALSPGRKLVLWFDCAAKRGVHVPQGFMGVAKMLDSLANRELRLGLEPVVATTLAKLMQERLTQQEPAAPSAKADIAFELPIAMSRSRTLERLREVLPAEVGKLGMSVQFARDRVAVEGSGPSAGVRGSLAVLPGSLKVELSLGALKGMAPVVQRQLQDRLAVVLR